MNPLISTSRVIIHKGRWLFRKPHWSSLPIAACFGMMAGVADDSLLSVAVSALICFWLLHSTGKFAFCIACGSLQPLLLSIFAHGSSHWFSSNPRHQIGVNFWIFVLQFMCGTAWLIAGLVIVPGLFGEFIDSLAKRRNNEVSYRFLFALLILPYTVLLILPVIIWGGLDR